MVPQLIEMREAKRVLLSLSLSSDLWTYEKRRESIGIREAAARACRFWEVLSGEAEIGCISSNAMYITHLFLSLPAALPSWGEEVTRKRGKEGAETKTCSPIFIFFLR